MSGMKSKKNNSMHRRTLWLALALALSAPIALPAFAAEHRWFAGRPRGRGRDDHRQEPGDGLRTHGDGGFGRQLPLPVPAGRQLHRRSQAERPDRRHAGQRQHQPRQRDHAESRGASTELETVQVQGTSISPIDVTSTEIRDERHRRTVAAPADRARCAVGGAARAGRGARRIRRHLLRRFVGRGKRGLHQRPERHRLLQPRRQLQRAVRVLPGVPGQDRRLLGRIRPHHRRRDQRRHQVGHQRIQVRRRAGVGARLAAVHAEEPCRPRLAVRRIRSREPEPLRVRPADQGSPVLLRHVRRRAITSRATPTTQYATFFDGDVRQRLLGRQARLAHHRRPHAVVPRLLRQRLADHRRVRDRSRRRFDRRAHLPEHHVQRERRRQLGADLQRLPHRHLLDARDVRREPALDRHPPAWPTTRANSCRTAATAARFIGGTSNTAVIAREDDREQSRIDFEWQLGDHLLRFGYDHESNTSEYNSRYPGDGASFRGLRSAAARPSTTRRCRRARPRTCARAKCATRAPSRRRTRPATSRTTGASPTASC